MAGQSHSSLCEADRDMKMMMVEQEWGGRTVVRRSVREERRTYANMEAVEMTTVGEMIAQGGARQQGDAV